MFFLCNVHAPNAEVEKNFFIFYLNGLIEKMGRIILMGDFNTSFQ